MSGGEPTKHSRVEDVIQCAYDVGFEHVVLISNGKRIGEDPAFTKRIATRFPRIEVYLQFDSLRPHLIEEIRGHDYSLLRQNAMTALALNNIDTTLVCVVKRGELLETLGETIEYAMSFDNVVGVTLQPLRSSGRHADEELGFGLNAAPTTGEVVHAVSSQLEIGPPVKFVHHPLSPVSIAVAYYDRDTGVDRSADVMRLIPNGVVTPLIQARPTSMPSLFRVLVVTYMDLENFDSQLLRRAPIHVLRTDGHLPLDAHYLYPQSADIVTVSITRPSSSDSVAC